MDLKGEQMKTDILRFLTISAVYFSLNPALAADTLGGIAAPASTAVPAGRIASRFEGLAGSPENAASLVGGLRSGGATLSSTDSTSGVRFAPATTPIGYGNITRALSLAQHQLAAQGIEEPTPEQMRIALNGGTLTSTDRSGITRSAAIASVLELRSQGIGWGRIAHQLAVNPGNHPPPALTGPAGTVASTQAGVDTRGRSHGQGAIVSGDDSILHARAPGHSSAAQGAAQARTSASFQDGAGAKGQVGRPSFATPRPSIGIGYSGKGLVQGRGNGRL